MMRRLDMHPVTGLRRDIAVAAAAVACLLVVAQCAVGVAVVDDVGVGKVKPLCIDANADGLPDRWQDTLLDGKTGDDALPGGDADLDGVSNLDEFYGGTDPDDANSSMRIVSVDLATETGSDLVIQWEGGGFNGPTQYVNAGDAPSRTFSIGAGTDADGARAVQGTVGGVLQVTNSWTHTNAVDGTSLRFYQISVSMAGNTRTNVQEWAMLTQSRTDNSRSLVSVPLDFGANNKLDSLLGAHLARGLHAGATEAEADTIEFLNAEGNYETCYLYDDGGNAVWYYQGQPATQTIARGQAFFVTRKSGARGRTDAVLVGPCYADTSFDMAFTTNNASQGWSWQRFGWPHEKSASFTGASANEHGLAEPAHGGTSARTTGPGASHGRLGDQIWYWDDASGGGWKYYWLVEGTGNAAVDGKWWDPHANGGNGGLATFDLEPGRGYYYRQHVATNGAPTGTNFIWEVARP